MIVIYNVVVVFVMVGLLGCEGVILCKIVLLIFYYFVLTGIIGMIVIYGFNMIDVLMNC